MITWIFQYLFLQVQKFYRYIFKIDPNIMTKRQFNKLAKKLNKVFAFSHLIQNNEKNEQQELKNLIEWHNSMTVKMYNTFNIDYFESTFNLNGFTFTVKSPVVDNHATS